jgi:hypothetical protein
LEMYVMCCAIPVGIIMRCLLLRKTYLMINEILNRSESITTPVCRVGNSGILALSSCLNRLMIGRFSEFSHLMKSQFYSLT